MASLMQPSFAAGELSPELRRRIDLAKYSVGAEIINNMAVMARGGVKVRPGTAMIAEGSIYTSRLVDFVYSTEQAYILEFGHRYMRVYKDGGIVMNGDGHYLLATEYEHTDLALLKFEQSADTLYITHPNFPPAVLVRSGHASWAASFFDNRFGPFLPENSAATTLTVTKTSSPSDATINAGASVTITASASLFSTDDVRSVWGVRALLGAGSWDAYIAQNINYESPAYLCYGEWQLVIYPRGSGIDNISIGLYKSIDDGTTWTKIHTVPATTSSASVIITGSLDEVSQLKIVRGLADDNCDYTLTSYGKTDWGCFKISAYTSATVVTGTMQNHFTNGAVAFKTWAEAAWSYKNGWPSSVCFYQDRLGFGNTQKQPSSFWYSKTGDYTNFGKSLPALEDDAITSRLLGRTVNPIQWMVPLQANLMLTSDSEWTVEPQVAGMFSADKMQIKQQSYYGGESTVEPVICGDTAIYVQRNGKAVRGMSYDDVRGKQQQDLSIMANHLFDGAYVVDWAYQQYPHSILWCVLNTGKMLSFTYHKEHEVWAWARHETEGLVESIACIPGTGQDEVYLLVNRTIDGSSVRFIEIMAPWSFTTAANWFGVDCGLTYSGAATSTVTGLSHLEGETVEILADGIAVGRQIVTDGTVTLPRAATKVHVGMPYDYQLKTLQVDVSSKNTGYGSDKKKLIQGVTVSVQNSMGGRAGLDNQYSLLSYPRNGLYSGDIEQKLNSSWSKDGQFELIGSGVLPMHIINLMPQVIVGGT